LDHDIVEPVEMLLDAIDHIRHVGMADDAVVELEKGVADRLGLVLDPLQDRAQLVLQPGLHRCGDILRSLEYDDMRLDEGLPNVDREGLYLGPPLDQRRDRDAYGAYRQCDR